MKIQTPVIFIIISYILFERIHADQIFLVNGQQAVTEIADTSGCAVVIMRKGKKVTLQKRNIDKIIWNGDTVSYAGYVCPEKPVKAMKFQETPEYRLMMILDKSEELEQKFRDGAKVACLTAPLSGNADPDEFRRVQKPLVELIKSKADVSILTPAEMVREVTAKNHRMDYAFLARKYHLETGNNPGTPGFVKTMTGTGYEKKKDLFTIADFLLLDIKRGVVVFHARLHEKRSVWGTEDTPADFSLLPQAVKEQRIQEKTDRKIDRNVKALSIRLERKMAAYLGIAIAP